MEPLTARDLLSLPTGFFVTGLLCDAVGDTTLGFWDAEEQTFNDQPLRELDSAQRFSPHPGPSDENVEPSDAELSAGWFNF